MCIRENVCLEIRAFSSQEVNESNIEIYEGSGMYDIHFIEYLEGYIYNRNRRRLRVKVMLLIELF